MRNAILTLALVLSFATIASAGELRRNGSSQNSGSSSGWRPPVTMQNERGHSQSNTMRVLNTGADSLRAAARVANQAAACTAGQYKKTPMACDNTDKTNSHRNMNLTNLNGCTIIRSGQASCYGNHDGFVGGPTLIGPFDPTDMTAAYNDARYRGKILVVRNTRINQTRAVTITDTGGFGKYGRVIDLSAGAFNAFGLRCDRDGIMRNVEIYVCPNT